MRLRSLLFGTAALVGVTLMPSRAYAGTGVPGCNGAGYFATLGLGGKLVGCFGGTLTELGEDAGLVSSQSYCLGNFGVATGSPNNAPSVGGTVFFNDDCGSSGGGTFAFCTGGFAKPPVNITNLAGELVLGLNVPDLTYGAGGYWVYSGDQTRNAYPAPPGFQQVLLQLTLGGVDQVGQFLFGWEDLNTGCSSQFSATNNRYAMEDLTNGTELDSRLNSCVTFNPGGSPDSDSDFNDSYIQFSIQGIPLENPVPEPMTMSLMALGLVGLGGASLRRRKNRSM